LSRTAGGQPDIQIDRAYRHATQACGTAMIRFPHAKRKVHPPGAIKLIPLTLSILDATEPAG